jgi:hypothetical protein
VRVQPTASRARRARATAHRGRRCRFAAVAGGSNRHCWAVAEESRAEQSRSGAQRRAKPAESERANQAQMTHVLPLSVAGPRRSPPLPPALLSAQCRRRGWATRRRRRSGAAAAGKRDAAHSRENSHLHSPPPPPLLPSFLFLSLSSPLSVCRLCASPLAPLRHSTPYTQGTEDAHEERG